MARTKENLPFFHHLGTNFRGIALQTRDHGLPDPPRLRYIARMSPVRIAGFALVGIAVLFLVGNLYFMMVDAPGGGITLYDLWTKVSFRSLEFCRYIIERYVWAALWQGIAVLLNQSAWLIFGIVGLILIGLGRKDIE